MSSRRPPRPTRPQRTALLAVLGLALLAAAPRNAAAGEATARVAAKSDAAHDAQPASVLLVRHAETAAGDDPALSEEGLRRAEALAALLADEGIERVLATDTRRTRATAAPLAHRLGIEIEIYDPRALGELAAKLAREGGVILVVGHSNTTPELVRRLGGDAGSPIAHDEHDRLYRVDPASGETVLERFAPPQP